MTFDNHRGFVCWVQQITFQHKTYPHHESSAGGILGNATTSFYIIIWYLHSNLANKLSCQPFMVVLKCLTIFFGNNGNTLLEILKFDNFLRKF